MSSHIGQRAWYGEEKKARGHTENDTVLFCRARAREEEQWETSTKDKLLPGGGGFES